VDGLTAFVSGGFFLDGSIITPLDEDEIRSIVRRALALDICSFCVCGVFSPCRRDQEERVAEIIHEESPTAYITLSHEIAGLGLSERENASILNASLRPLATRTIGAIQGALPPGVPLFLTKNVGTLLSSEDSTRWPVFTFASGPTNSMIGAAYLSGINNGIVIDVGGTSMDIGFIVDGRPMQTQAVSTWTLFRCFFNCIFDEEHSTD
jgi:N-methylhydantoinase A/oxoprolinase/acetone carboxylase beta subunit